MGFYKWIFVVFVALLQACGSGHLHLHVEQESISSHLHGVSSAEYVLVLKPFPSENVPKNRPSHLRYVLNIPTKHFETFFVFQLCALNEQKAILGHTCYNPFSGGSGELILNQHNINDIFDIPRRLGIAVTSLVEGVFPVVYYVLDHQLQVFLASTAVVGGASLGTWYVLDQNHKAYKQVMGFARRKPQFSTATKPSPALLKAMQASPHYRSSFRGPAMRQAVRMMGLKLASERVLSIVGRGLTVAIVVAGASAFGYVVMPERGKSVVHRAAKKMFYAAKGRANELLFMALKNNDSFSVAPLQRARLQDMALALNEKEVFLGSENTVENLPYSVLDLVPALGRFMLSERISQSIDVTEYCLPTSMQERKQCSDI